MTERPRVLVLGGGGMLGSAVAAEAAAHGALCQAPGRETLDLCDTAAIETRLAELRPQVVFNCAAFTDVDACESREEHALEVNGAAVGRLAALIERRGGLLVHVSSDYVFDGLGEQPYTEEARTGPRSAYGRSKLAGELGALAASRSLVVRASWLFGPGGRNFVATVRQLAATGQPLRIVADQVGRPTYTPYLARALWRLATLARAGRVELASIVHYGNAPVASWYDLACRVLEVWELDAAIEPVSTAAFPRPAPRPSYSVLAVERYEHLVGESVESWVEGLFDYQRREEHA